MKTQLEYNRNFFQSSPSVQGQRRGSDNVTAVSSTQQQQAKQPIDTDPLPRTLQDALRPCKSRSIVITEKYAPFRIVNVNSCWEQLCGYSYIESKGKTLGSLLRGPQTDPLTATTMIAKLLQGEDDVGATLINYKKDGQAFYNRIRAGPLFDEETGDISHFVGLLQEIGNVTISSDSHRANGYESSFSNDESKKQNVYA
jgi:PAS domain S-box-containing protein